MKITEKTAALVTGGASGLGLAVTCALREAGAKVAIFDVNEEKGKQVASQTGALFCRVDVTSDAEVEAGFAAARAANGQERILINCAGGGKAGKTVSRDKVTGDIKRYPIEKFLQVMNLNLVGTFRCIATSAAGMLGLDPLEDGERGVITNTASVAAQEGQIGQVAYSAAKAGIAGMTLTIARDLASEGIRVNTILPGIMATPPMMSAPPKMLQALADSVPFPKRLGEPTEFASLVLEFVRNRYFNGSSVRLDGAIRMPPR